MDRLELIQVDVNYNYSERLEGGREAKQTYIYICKDAFLFAGVLQGFLRRIFSYCYVE